MASRNYNVFISYSRADSAVKDNIIKYLTPYITNKRMTIWHDRELVAGDIFDEKIKEKLNKSDICIFILSQDYINSDYCREVEEDLALKKFDKCETNSFRIIPIVARDCITDYTRLSQFHIPLDKKPISDFSDPTKAYVTIAKDIKDVLDYLDTIEDYSPYTSKSDDTMSNVSSNSYNYYLNDLGFTVQKSGVDNIFLDDLFVYPDLKKLNNEIEKTDIFIDAKKIFEHGNFLNKKILVLGDEQSGKTTLSKVIYKRALANGLFPVLIEGDSIKSAQDYEKTINKAISTQYSDAGLYQTSRCVLIIDDINKSPLNERFKRALLNNLITTYNSIILLSDTVLRMQEQIMHELTDFTAYEIQSFGSRKKDEIIERWNMLGFQETEEIAVIQSSHDHLVRSVDSIMMKNIVPSKPIFVIMILQILETSNNNDYSLTSYGHCYHSLIIDAFNRANIKKDQFGDYFNYLSELAFHIYELGVEKISLEELSTFQEKYSSRYFIISHQDTFDKILKSRIISQDYNDELSFQYKYLFYFFVAKSITDNEALLEQVDYLCEKLHSEKHANILIFITHHTNNKTVIKSIVKKVAEIFPNVQPAKLNTEEVSFLNSFADKIDKLVVIKKSIDVNKERKESLEQKDLQEKEALLEIIDDDEEESVEEVNRDLLDVNRSYRALEILGQIIRNRKGSLQIQDLDQLGIEAYNVGLRFLNYYLGLTQSMQSEIIEEIQRLITTKKSWSTERISQEARFYYWTFSYMMSLQVVRKTAFSIGHKDLMPFYEKMSTSLRSEVANLIEIQIELEFTKKIPKGKISNLWERLGDNILTRRLLQEIVVRHLHLNYVDYNEKQWLSHKIKLAVEDQELYQTKVKRINKIK
ncbi:TIR domain-containing protein [Aeromonas taiwanensis]|uniref:TIR domain-containing protein n=1 Tax=Aeromonas taiwanensis TaxID=633417 RepID=UPI003BA33889